MSDIPEEQIESWLKKLERESWQLELLVSAFTIFLLIGANSQFDEFLLDFQYRYNIDGPMLSVGYIFLILIQKSILALTICLVVHLMLRGFWIGAIGLRSVQSTIDFKQLNYNDFFTDKLKKKVISLDRMVIMLDEICSVIFAFSFLIISVLVAYGMFLAFLGVSGFVFSTIIGFLPKGLVYTILIIVTIILFIIFILAGIIYAIDYLTLGFFKKIRWFSKVYYPFYRLYNFITLAGLSRSIYYYLISKFSKKRIRLVYSLVGIFVMLTIIFSFDQYQYFPNDASGSIVKANYYDDQRPDSEYVSSISLESKYIDKSHVQVFFRYSPRDNELIAAQCPDFKPLKEDGLNLKLQLIARGGNLQITGRDFSAEDSEQLLSCQKSIYEVSVNDSVYTSLKYHFYIHPQKDQKGLLATIPSEGLVQGENVLTVRKISPDSTKGFVDYVSVPFWFHTN